MSLNFALSALALDSSLRLRAIRTLQVDDSSLARTYMDATALAPPWSVAANSWLTESSSAGLLFHRYYRGGGMMRTIVFRLFLPFHWKQDCHSSRAGGYCANCVTVPAFGGCYRGEG